MQYLFLWHLPFFVCDGIYRLSKYSNRSSNEFANGFSQSCIYSRLITTLSLSWSLFVDELNVFQILWPIILRFPQCPWSIVDVEIRWFRILKFATKDMLESFNSLRLAFHRLSSEKTLTLPFVKCGVEVHLIGNHQPIPHGIRKQSNKS